MQNCSVFKCIYECHPAPCRCGVGVGVLHVGVLMITVTSVSFAPADGPWSTGESTYISTSAPWEALTTYIYISDYTLDLDIDVIFKYFGCIFKILTL